MGVANSAIREEIRRSGVLYWQVAQMLGLHDSNFSRLLRVELSAENAARVLAAVKKAREVYVDGDTENARS